MTNLLKAEKTLNFPNNKSYKARMSLDIIMQVETALSTSILKVANKLSAGELTLTEIITILTLGVRGGGNDVKDNEIKQLVSEMGLVRSIAMTGDLLALALNVDSDEVNADEKKSEN